MFGMGFSEVLVIAIVAIIFLGPEKLPDAMVKVAKFFKTVKNSVNDVKSSFEQEMKIQELKEEALTYKKKLEETTASMIANTIANLVLKLLLLEDVGFATHCATSTANII